MLMCVEWLVFESDPSTCIIIIRVMNFGQDCAVYMYIVHVYGMQ